ncbi:MAG: DUF4367 domain-containing protein [Nitrospiraceae bacterium]|nr:DUF4367 domain-containing protein [Nitrospiraceae bacterium]
MSLEKRFRPHQFIKFGFIVFVMAAVLALLNWMPTLIQQHRLQRFGSIDEVRKELHISKIYLPTYIPEGLNLAWPPSEVYAQDTPFAACIMQFSFRGRKETELVIQQAAADAPYRLEPAIRIRKRDAGNTITVKDRKALFVRGVCDREVPCCQLTWDEGGTIITLTGKIPAREIVRIAASMLPEK